MSFDREQIHMVIALFVVAVIAAAILGITDIYTREPIAQAQKEALRKALQQVLPQHGNDAQADQLVFGKKEETVTIYPAKSKTGDVIGIAWQVVAADGYAGSIRILVGIKPDGAVYAIRITDHRETPGLGDGIVNNDSWLASFVDQRVDSINWKVKKDGGDFDQFTGATITPRAVVKAVKGALDYYQGNNQQILQALKQANHAGASVE